MFAYTVLVDSGAEVWLLAFVVGGEIEAFEGRWLGGFLHFSGGKDFEEGGGEWDVGASGTGETEEGAD